MSQEKKSRSRVSLPPSHFLVKNVLNGSGRFSKMVKIFLKSRKLLGGWVQGHAPPEKIVHFKVYFN